LVQCSRGWSLRDGISINLTTILLGLKWEQEMNTPRGDKWLLIISLVVGLSFGVHFMALLTIPAIDFLYYFKTIRL
jgi:membrane-bound acyltransferase YfiQ involved in biofilm formation